MKVSVCIRTDRRPRSLQRLLDALVWLRADRAAAGLEVVVIDADPAGSAREACAETAPRLPWPLRYVHGPGASAAAAAGAVRADAEWIAFLDDDQEPTPRWLDELLRVQAAYGADVVAGPVVPRFEGRVPAWVLGGRLFELPRHGTGTRLPYADGGNVLVRAAVLRGRDRGTSAGAVPAGAQGIVWADEALAYEWIPPSRVTLPWMLRRAFRWGNAWAIRERHAEAGIRAGVVRLGRAAGRIARSTLLLAASAVRGRRAAVLALRGICFGAGSLAGLAGFRVGEPFLG